MKSYFRCPECRRRHNKTYQYGAVRGQSGNMVARATHHPDVTCDCGATLAGYNIVGGVYDDRPTEPSPFSTAMLAGIVNGAFAGGITYIFASETTSMLVGLGVALVCLVFLWVFISYERRMQRRTTRG
jgi:hypothetical protein